MRLIRKRPVKVFTRPRFCGTEIRPECGSRQALVSYNGGFPYQRAGASQWIVQTAGCTLRHSWQIGAPPKSNPRPVAPTALTPPNATSLVLSVALQREVCHDLPTAFFHLSCMKGSTPGFGCVSIMPADPSSGVCSVYTPRQSRCLQIQASSVISGSPWKAQIPSNRHSQYLSG